MNKILFLNACVRPQSRTRLLAERVLGKMTGTVEEVNLEQARIPPLAWATLQQRDACVRDEDFSDPILQYARQFAAADDIVIAAPYWDLAFPASLRVYFEAVTVSGLTFRCLPDGSYQGLCRAKRMIYVTTAGGVIGDLNLGFDHVKALAQAFYGIPQVLCHTAERLDILGEDIGGILAKALAAIDEDGSI